MAEVIEGGVWIVDPADGRLKPGDLSEPERPGALCSCGHAEDAHTHGCCTECLCVEYSGQVFGV